MPKQRKHRDDRQIDDARPIDPDRFYRKAEIIRRRFFGYGVSQFDEKIKKGELPPLINLSETGRASGLYGRTIINLQEELEAKAAAKRQAIAEPKSTPWGSTRRTHSHD